MTTDLLKETLLWIESIPFSEDEIRSTNSSMNGGANGEKEDEVEQFYLSKHIFFKRWLNIFRKGRLRRRSMIVDINFTLITHRIKLKYSFLRWHGIVKKEMSCPSTTCSSTLRYRFRKRNCLLYWMLKAKTRRKGKLIFFRQWISRFVQKKTLWKVF